MLAKIFHIMHQELLLYRAAVETERDKRWAILAADGRKMQDFTQKTDIFIREADALEQKREAALAEFLGANAALFAGKRPALSDLVELGERDQELDRAIFTQVRDQFAATIRALKSETEENRRLMEKSAASLHRALTEIQNKADPRDGTYRPEGAKKQAKAAVLLNANA